ncbi:MAG: exosortase/archaeosortase family protein [Phycisphaerales bacterium]
MSLAVTARQPEPALSRQAALEIGALAIAFVAFFWAFLFRQGKYSLDPDWSHSFLVPLVSLYYIYEHRRSIFREPVRTNWLGLALIFVGMAGYFIFTLRNVGNHTAQGWSMILALLGLTLLLLGFRMWKALLFPQLYLVLGVTVSPRALGLITPTLQRWAAAGSYYLLNVLGFDTDISGNVLTVHRGGESFPLNVAEACSGMRMIVGFVALGVAVAFLSCRYWWQRLLVIACAIPIAILVNVLRVATIGVMTTVDRDWAAGDAHLAIGMVWLLPALAMYMGLVWILKRLVIEGEPASRGGAA